MVSAAVAIIVPGPALGPRSDDDPTIDGIEEVQLGIFTARTGNLFPVCRGGPLWHLGLLWTAQCVLGRLRPVRGLHSQAQLVFARGNDPDPMSAWPGWLRK